MLQKILSKLNAYTKKRPTTLLSVALVLLVLLVVSNVLIFLGLVKRDSVLRKIRKYLIVMRRSGVEFSEDMTAELQLDDDVNELALEAEKVKSEMISEGMEEEPEMEMEVEEEESVDEETEEEAVEAFSGEVQEYSSF